MGHEHMMDGWTKTGTAPLLLVLLLLTSGCSLAGKRSVEHASALSYVPFRAATKPAVSTPYQAEACFFGYHDTCWRPWPDCWMPCSGAKTNSETSDVIPPSVEEVIPAPSPGPIEMAVPPELPGQ